MVGQNHLAESLFYNEVLDISCNLLNTVLKVTSRMILNDFNDPKGLFFLVTE